MEHLTLTNHNLFEIESVSRLFCLQDSGRWSVGAGDDDSSGVFSYNSQDVQSFSRDWLAPTHQPPPRCFEGVWTNPHLLQWCKASLHKRFGSEVLQHSVSLQQNIMLSNTLYLKLNNSINMNKWTENNGMYTTTQKLRVGKSFWKKSHLCSPRLHLFDHNTVKR